MLLGAGFTSSTRKATPDLDVIPDARSAGGYPEQPLDQMDTMPGSYWVYIPLK